MGEKEPKMKQHIKETHRRYALCFCFPWQGSIHRSLRSMLGVWLNQYKDDFNEPPNFPCLRLVVDFCRKYRLIFELSLNFVVKEYRRQLVA